MAVISRKEFLKSLIVGLTVFILFAVLTCLTDGRADVEISFKFASAFFVGMLLYYAIGNLQRAGRIFEVKLIVFSVITLMLVNNIKLLRLFTFSGIVVLICWIIALANLIHTFTSKR